MFCVIARSEQKALRGSIFASTVLFIMLEKFSGVCCVFVAYLGLHPTASEPIGKHSIETRPKNNADYKLLLAVDMCGGSLCLLTWPQMMRL